MIIIITLIKLYAPFITKNITKQQILKSLWRELMPRVRGHTGDRAESRLLWLKTSRGAVNLSRELWLPVCCSVDSSWVWGGRGLNGTAFDGF